MVSIIIVNYNTSDMLLDCVTSIYACVHDIDFEIIVADNGSCPEELTKLQSDNRFCLLSLGENLGFGKANNVAAQHARGELLFMLNPDTVLFDDAVSTLSHFMKQHPDVGICGGNIFDANRHPAHSYHMMFPSIASEMDFAMSQIYRKFRYGTNSQFNHTAQPLDVAMITGADLMISRHVWNECGGFDPIFFMYYEDADLCRRVRQLGYRVVNVPTAHVIHYEGKSFDETPDRCRRILDGRFKYFRKHYSSFYNSLSNILNLVTIRLAILYYSLSSKQREKTNFQIRLNEYKRNTQ